MLGSSIDPIRHKAYEELKLRSDVICMPCDFAPLLRLNPNVLRAMHRGHRFYAEGNWELALKTYTEALQAVFALGGDVHSLSTILSNRSAANAQLGRWQTSLEDAEQVVFSGGDMHKPQTPTLTVCSRLSDQGVDENFDVQP